MKFFLAWISILITVFCFSYSYAADPILIRTDCFDAILTHGINSLSNGGTIHWVKVADLKLKDPGVMLKFGVQDTNGLEKSGLVTPADTFNGHTVYFNAKYPKFLVEVLHNGEVQFTTEYIDF